MTTLMTMIGGDCRIRTRRSLVIRLIQEAPTRRKTLGVRLK